MQAPLDDAAGAGALPLQHDHVLGPHVVAGSHCPAKWVHADLFNSVCIFESCLLAPLLILF